MDQDLLITTLQHFISNSKLKRETNEKILSTFLNNEQKSLIKYPTETATLDDRAIVQSILFLIVAIKITNKDISEFSYLPNMYVSDCNMPLQIVNLAFKSLNEKITADSLNNIKEKAQVSTVVTKETKKEVETPASEDLDLEDLF